MTEEQTGKILAEFMRRVDAGESVDVEAICQSHPKIADALRSYVAGAAMADGLPQKDTSQAYAQQETLKPSAAHPTDSELIGQMFGRYKVERQLGEGAMGAVYLAHDTQLDRPVALKIPKVGYGEKEEFLTRFQREAQAAAKLNHPGICSVFDFGEQDGRPYITMAHIDGQPLSRFIGTTQVNQQWVVEVIREVADALQHAHQAGVVHRDLKAGNVLIDKDGKPVVTDFGLARNVSQSDESRITQEGAILGTPGYMSPEQVEGNLSKIGPATDIYALGAMLFELLTGELPFRGSIHSILAQIARDEPQNPLKLNPDAHPKLCALSLEMMSKEIGKRPASMQDVVDRLSDWSAEPSPEELAAQNKQDERQQKLESGKQKVADLIKRGQYAQAIKLLEKMSGITDANAVGYASWARDELKRVKELPKKVREGIPSLVATAKKLIEKHDYGQAAEMLQQIPRELRTPEIQELTDKAIDLQDEVDLLLADLHECVNRKQYVGIDGNVKRLLHLKPKNKFAQDLWEALNTYGKVPPKQRKYRFDEKGKLLPKGSTISGTTVIALLVALLSFGGMTYAITIYLKSGNETLTVQVDNELLANGDITLSFDGQNHVITKPEFRLTVKPGEFRYGVSQGNRVVPTPQQFTVVKDGGNVLEIGVSEPTSLRQAVPDDIEDIHTHEQPDDKKLLATPSVPRPQPINLLARIDPNRDFIDPRLRIENGKLHTPPRDKRIKRNALMMIPLNPVPEEYDVHLLVERKAGFGLSCNMGIVMGGHRAVVDMEGGSQEDPRWCLSRIDGFSMHDEGKNLTINHTKMFHVDQLVDVEIQVRRNSVTVNANGKQIIYWTGRPEQLSVWEAIEPELTDDQSLFFFSQAQFVIHEMTLTPVSIGRAATDVQ